ncbi:MAG: hypothetical protein J6M47_12190 [Clostridia bacterium]|nr:hypothetical protein [Clostridia bacterium]
MKTGSGLNMTAGSPTRLLILFAIPMLIGNLFQQAYSLADSVIVGQVLGCATRHGERRRRLPHMNHEQGSCCLAGTLFCLMNSEKCGRRRALTWEIEGYIIKVYDHRHCQVKTVRMTGRQGMSYGRKARTGQGGAHGEKVCRIHLLPASIAG